MRFKEYLINEDTYKKEILTHLKSWRKDDHYVCFSNVRKPQQKQLVKDYGFNGVIAFPVKYIFNKLKRGEMLGIPNWATKGHLVILQQFRGKTLNIKEYNKGETFDANVKKLKTLYFKNTPEHTNREANWDTIIFDAAKARSKSVFLRLLYIMKEVEKATGYNLNNQFAKLGFTSIFSPDGPLSLKTENPEICFLNWRNIKYLEVIDNI